MLFDVVGRNEETAEKTVSKRIGSPNPANLPGSPNEGPNLSSPVTTPRGGAGHLSLPVRNNAASALQRSSSLSAAPSANLTQKVCMRLLSQILQVSGMAAGSWRVYEGSDIDVMLQSIRVLFLKQPTLLELAAPVNICGDTHGQFHDLIRVFNMIGQPGQRNFLFLGDYVDRGKNSLDVIALVYAYKLLYPEHVFLLRGNHEMASTSRSYGFYDEVKRRHNVKMWRQFVDVFNCMPPAALVGGRILCMHGGISPVIEESLEPIREIVRPIEVTENGLLTDLLWADPCENTVGWRQSDRGISYCFGADMVERVCQNLDIDLICRGHQVVEDGYEFFCGRRLITIFTAPNYFGEYNNAAGVMVVDENLKCTLKTLQPVSEFEGQP